MLSFLKRILSSKSPSWKEVERFDPAWKARIARMASFIQEDDASVVDVGCGPMWLREYIGTSVRYTGIDYVYRANDMIVCDLNVDGFPDIRADVWFVSGCLEYLNEPEAFIKWISERSGKCIISYCGMENFPEMEGRKKRGWVNHLTSERISSIFEGNGMKMDFYEVLPSMNSVFVFKH